MAKVIEKSKKKNSLPTLIGAGVMIIIAIVLFFYLQMFHKMLLPQVSSLLC